MKKKSNKTVTQLAVLCLMTALAWFLPLAGGRAKAAEAPTAVLIPMPGFVVEQWSAPRPMLVHQTAAVTQLPDRKTAEIGKLAQGELVNAWGQTDTGWYFVECQGTLGYVRYEAAAFLSPEQLAQWQAQLEAQTKAREEAQKAAEQAAAQAAALAAREAQIQVLAAQQPPVAAGIVFIGDSRMVTLKDAVEKNIGICPAAVIAKNGSRYEWFHDTAIPQADRIIGTGSKVVINMGVNDLSHADQYAKDVNFWAAVWSARGAQVYYASVNPVWANDSGITQEQVDLFNQRLKPQLIPQVIWLDSSTYLRQSGVHAVDGLHYREDTNLVLYHYYMGMIGAL